MSGERQYSEREVSPSRGSRLVDANRGPGGFVSNQKTALAERADLNSQQEGWGRLGKISGRL